MEKIVCRQEVRRRARITVKQNNKVKKQSDMYNSKVEVGIKNLKEKYKDSVEKIQKEFKLYDYDYDYGNKDKNKNKNKDQDQDTSKTQTMQEFIAIALLEAERIWLNVQVMVLENFETYQKSSDEDKINLLRKDFKEFYDEFPIVSRYMICMGQYRKKAFHKFLLECQKYLMDVPDNREKGYMQDQWVRRQADYVRFLWEETQDSKLTKDQLKESDNIWGKTYDSLTNEFKDFKDLHKNTEEKVKKNDIKYKAELVQEFGTRLINNEQKLDTSDTIKLINILRNKVYKQRFLNVIKQIINDVIYIHPFIEGDGLNKEIQDEYEYEMKQFGLKKTYKKIT